MNARQIEEVLNKAWGVACTLLHTAAAGTRVSLPDGQKEDVQVLMEDDAVRKEQAVC